MTIARPLGRAAALLVAVAAPLAAGWALEPTPFTLGTADLDSSSARARGALPLTTGPSQTAAPLVLAQAQGDAGRQLAAVVARIGQLEEEVRRLRGRVEELEFNQRNLAPRGGAPSAAANPPTRAALPEPSPGLPSSPGVAAPGQPGALPAPAAPPAQVARVDPAAPARQQYESALALLQQGDWTAAENAFDGFLQRFPNDALAPNAAYWLGETHYIRKDYANAAAIFARNYRGYGPDSPKAPDNLLKLGMSLASLGDRERACQTFTELERRHGDAAAPVRQALVRERAAAGCS